MMICLLIAASVLSASCMTMGGTDVNGDGRISRKEAAKSPEISAAFGVADANNDGQFDPDEFDAAKEWLRETDRGPGSPARRPWTEWAQALTAPNPQEPLF